MFCEFTIYDDLSFSHTDGEEDNVTKCYVESIVNELSPEDEECFIVKREDDKFYVYSWRDDVVQMWDEDVN